MLRRDLILRRKSFTLEVVNVKSRKVFENFKICGFKKVIKKVLVYLPINNEINTNLIIEYFKKNETDIFMPAFINGKWVISEFVNVDDLSCGPFGTSQPSVVKEASVDQLDLAIVPCVAFCRNGFRLGYGKGVYDKLLKDFCGIKVGFAYDFQIVNNFSPESHDIKMDYLITESKVIEVLFPNK